jgi:hypothetical protein
LVLGKLARPHLKNKRQTKRLGGWSSSGGAHVQHVRREPGFLGSIPHSAKKKKKKKKLDFHKISQKVHTSSR